MESNYGVGVTNRFFLCDEYDDPSDIVTQGTKDVSLEEKENKAVKPTTEKKKPAAKKTGKTPKAEPNVKPAVQGKAGQRNGEARVKLSDNEERNNRRNKTDSQRFESGRRQADGERPPRRNNERGDRPPRRFEGEQGEGNGGGRRFDGPRRFEGEGGDRRYDGERRFNNEGQGRMDGGEGGFRGRGRGMGRGGRGGMAGRGGRRDFDRHSGSQRSGVRPTDKRDGGGAYNWGSNKEIIEDEEKVTAEDKEKADTADEGIGQSGGEESANEAKEPEEPEEMTLAEYKAMMKAKRAKPELNIRKAGEGENSEQWKSTFVLKKKDDVKEKKVREKVAESSDDEKEVEQKARTKFVLDIDFRFADSPGMRGRGRGRGRGMGERGRGMGMGRGGREGGRGGYERQQQTPKMDDMNFPSLK